jgi:hypothetical protein
MTHPGTVSNKNGLLNVSNNSLTSSSSPHIPHPVANTLFKGSDIANTSIVPNQNFAIPFSAYDAATARHLTGLLQTELRNLVRGISFIVHLLIKSNSEFLLTFVLFFIQRLTT